MTSLSAEREQEIRRILGQRFDLHELRFEDFSDQHAGHSVQARHGGSHVHLYVLSPAFSGLSRVERSRRVHEALSPLLSSGKIHALTLKLVSPEEEK
ncbi:MAG: BolA family protein [Bdellovibrionota bacterium]